MTGSRRLFRTKPLAGEYFTSPEIYALESHHIFRQSWLCVGRAEEILAPGQFLLLEIDGESLILLRDDSGTVRCFYNVCRHRGTRLCDEAGGTFSGAIRCPYHAWTYDLSGRLIAAPNMRDVEDFDRDDYPLHEVGTAVWNGFVFVNLSADAPAFEDAYRPVMNKFDAWRMSELVSVHRCAYDVAANWKLILQNYNECYHCPQIHPRLNTLSHFRTAENDLDTGPFLGGPMELADGIESMTASGRACGTRLPGLNDKQGRCVYYYSLFPTLLLSPHPDFVLVHRVERLGIAQTRVVCEFLFPPDVAGSPEFDPTPAVGFWDETNRQDWRACELSQQGVSSTAYEPGPFSNLESIVAAFDTHYLDVLGRESA